MKWKNFLIEILCCLVLVLSVVYFVVWKEKEYDYVTKAKEYKELVSEKIQNGEYEFADKETTYYVHIDNLEKQDYLIDAYVVVTYDDEYHYYWTSIDKERKIELTNIQALSNEDAVKYNEKNNVIYNTLSQDGREKIVIIASDGTKQEKESGIYLTKEEAQLCFDYQEEETGVTILAYKDLCPVDVVIPTEIEEKKVVSINEYAFSSRQLESVQISKNIEEIGKYAFYNNSIEGITLGDSIKNIGEYAFAKNKLTQIETYEKTTLGNGIFNDNQLVENSFIYQQTTNGINYKKIISYAGKEREIIEIPKEKEGVSLEVIGNKSFYNMEIKKVIIPETVQKIEALAFSKNQLTSLTVPKKVESISFKAFSDNQISELTIENTKAEIKSGAFVNNRMSGEEAFIYKRTRKGIDKTILGSYAGEQKENIEIPSHIKVIESAAFNGAGIQSITIPSTVQTIEDGAFNNNAIAKGEENEFIYKREKGKTDYSYLSSYAGAEKVNITIPEEKEGKTITTLASGLFSGLQIEKITIPSTVKIIGENALYKSNTSNKELSQITNKSENKFDWGKVTGGTSTTVFVTGTIEHEQGSITVTD